MIGWPLRLVALAGGFAVALGVHAAAYYALFDQTQQHGLVESEVASVSLNLTESKVLEDVVQSDGEERPASDVDQAAAVAGSKDDKLEKPVEPPKPVEQQPKSDPKPIETPPKPAPEPVMQPKPQPLPETKAEVAPPTPVQPKPRPKIERKPPRKKLTPRRKGARENRAASKRRAASKKGVTRGQAKGPRAQSSGRRTASLGQRRAYAGLVNARIASRRPAGLGRSGVVMIAFAIAGNGRLRYARVARSSGIRRLDAAALGAVRRAAPFPRPPAGMTTRQLSFTIPFRFR